MTEISHWKTTRILYQLQCRKIDLQYCCKTRI